MKKITVAGSILCDNVKMIDCYPEIGMLANITSVSRSVGGCVPNTGITLARLGGKVGVVGRVGADESGEFVISQMKNEGIDTARVLRTESLPTSFTDVFTLNDTGERTFFNTQGANGIFDVDDINVDKLDCDIFHFGYLLLLRAMDGDDLEYGTRAARLLAKVRARGIKTSIDTVSDSTGRFAKVVTPAIAQCDYVIFNEIEGGRVAGLEPRGADGKLIIKNIEAILKVFYKMGATKAVIHCPEAGFMYSADGFTASGSLQLPAGYIKGTVGAGDSFCAGVLYAFANDYSDEAALRLGNCTAAQNLSSHDSIGGAVSLEKTMELEKKFAYRKI